MCKKFTTIALLVILLITNSSKSNAQIGTVVGLASNYLSLLKSNQNNIIYEIEDLEEIIEDHEKIAIIPFTALITYAKPPEYSVEDAEAQFENQQMIGKMLQEQFWDVFDNNRSNVSLQDVRITNKVLQDIGYFSNPSQYPPSYLAKLLNVDAVLICTYDIHVDNERTGWQNFTKAFSDLAMSQLKGFVPGLDALSFIKDPKALIDVVTKPGEFLKKLKEGDLSALTNLAGSMLPEGDWKKVADIAARNSKTIAKVARGDTANLFSDLIANNASALGADLKINPQVVKLIQNNSRTAQNLLTGKTQGLLFDIVNNNVATVAEQFKVSQGNELVSALSNNTTIIAKLATGDTSNLLNDLVTSNLGAVTELAGGGKNSQVYTDLLLKNKDLVSKIATGDFSNLTADFLVNNAAALGGSMTKIDSGKLSSLLSKKDLVMGLMNGGTDSLVSNLTKNSNLIFGEVIDSKLAGNYAKLLTDNKELVISVASGEKKGLIKKLLKSKSGNNNEELNEENVDALSGLLSNSGSLINNIFESNPNGVLSDLIKTHTGSSNKNAINKISDLLIKDNTRITHLLKGNKNDFVAALGTEVTDIDPNELSKITDDLIKNKRHLNKLIGVDQKKDFSILNKSSEDIQVLSLQLSQRKEIMSGIMSGEANQIAGAFSEEELQEQYDISPELMGMIGQSLVTEKKNVSSVLVNSKINQLLLNDQLDIQFFDFGEDALLEHYETVSLRDKSFSQTAASILNPASDPKDFTKITINIFSQENDEILWQYINENSKTRIYDMGVTVPKVIERVNKKFPYFVH